MKYVKLNSKRNAKLGMQELLGMYAPQDIVLVVYDLVENHVVCASDEGGPSSVAKYSINSSTASEMKKDGGGNRFALLAYNLNESVVHILDAVPELQIASALVLVATNVILGSALGGKQNYNKARDISREYDAEKRDVEKKKPLRDSRGRYVRSRSEETVCNYDKFNPLEGLRRMSMSKFD